MNEQIPAALPGNDGLWEELPMLDLDAPVVHGAPVIRPSAKRQPTVPEWNMMRPRIKELWIDQNKKFHEVKQALTAEFNFEPTKRQFTAKTAQWGLKKNSTKAERAEIVEKLAVAGEDEVPETGPFRFNEKKLMRWKKEAKEENAIRKQIFDVQDADADADVEFDAPFEMDFDDGSNVWNSLSENPIVGLDEFHKIPLVEANVEVNVGVDHWKPVNTEVSYLDANRNGDGDVGDVGDVEEILRARFLKMRDDPDAEDGHRRLTETLSTAAFTQGIENGTKKIWDAADIPGSPKLSRLFAAMNIASQVESFSLDETLPSDTQDGCLSQAQIFDLVKRDPVRPPEHDKSVDAAVSGVVARSKKRQRPLTISQPRFQKWLYRMLQNVANPLDEIDPFPRIVDLDDETSNPTPPQSLPWTSLEQQKLEREIKLKTLGRLLPANSLRLAEEMEMLGDIYFRMGKYERAGQWYQQVLATRANGLGADHPDTLHSALDVIRIKLDQGQYSQANKLHRVLHPKILSLSLSGSSLARRSIAIMADIEYYQGNYADSKSRNREVLQICLHNFGLRDISTWGALRNLAVDLAATEEYSQSEHLCAMAQQLRYEISSLEESVMQWNMIQLAEVLARQGMYNESCKLAREVMETVKRALGANHRDTLHVASGLGRCLRLQGELDESEELLRDVVARQTSLLGPDHVDTLSIMEELAHTLIGLQRWGKAGELLGEVYVGRAKFYGIDHPTIKVTWEWIIHCYAQADVELDDAAIDETLNTLVQKAMEAIQQRQEMEELESDYEESDEEEPDEEEPDEEEPDEEELDEEEEPEPDLDKLRRFE